MTRTIDIALASPYNKEGRNGSINATWYEDGKMRTDTIKTADRDYYYNALRKAYMAMIHLCPAQNQPILSDLAEKALADNFSDTHYLLSAAMLKDADPDDLLKSLRKYYKA